MYILLLWSFIFSQIVIIFMWSNQGLFCGVCAIFIYALSRLMSRFRFFFFRFFDGGSVFFPTHLLSCDNNRCRLCPAGTKRYDCHPIVVCYHRRYPYHHTGNMLAFLECFVECNQCVRVRCHYLVRLPMELRLAPQPYHHYTTRACHFWVYRQTFHRMASTNYCSNYIRWKNKPYMYHYLISIVLSHQPSGGLSNRGLYDSLQMRNIAKQRFSVID